MARHLGNASNADSGVGRLILHLLLAVSAIGLALTIPILYIDAMRSVRASRNAVADATAAELRTVDRSDGGAFAMAMRSLEGRYQLKRLRVVEGNASEFKPTQDRFYRNVRAEAIEIEFPPRQPPMSLPTVRLASVVAVVASIASLILLLVSLTSAMRPSSGAAGGSPDAERGQLARTYEYSIQTLKSRATELQHISDKERERAAELAAVSATLVRSLSSGFIAVDESGLIVDLNATARELLRIDPDAQVTRKSIPEGLGYNPFSALLEEAVAQRKTLQRVEVSLPETNAVLGLTTVPLLDDNNRYLGLLALFTDLGPIRKLETRVREMQSLADLGEIAAGIAHEFRNSLATVLGYLRLATRGELPAESLERIQRAEKEALQLNSAVESLLSYARPMRLKEETVDLRKLLDALVEGARPLAVDIAFEVSGGRVQVHADPTLLQRAFENLIRNSIEAIGERHGGGTIAIRVSGVPVPSVEITDDGVGVRSEDVPRLFLPFQSTKPAGTGLGLALVKKVMILHGGSVRLEGRPAGGATATLEFPAAQESPLARGD